MKENNREKDAKERSAHRNLLLFLVEKQKILVAETTNNVIIYSKGWTFFAELAKIVSLSLSRYSIRSRLILIRGFRLYTDMIYNFIIRRYEFVLLCRPFWFLLIFFI